MSAVGLDRATRPVVSIVMPTHGSWHWVRRALAAVAEHTDAPYEVILCDNASADGTCERLLDSVVGATVILNDRNLGFASACNQGSARSRAPHLVFLNSDAFVHAGWLGPLLDRATQEHVAAVAPLLLNLDGSVQDAGALVFRRGEIALYGYGGDPHDADWAFTRELDYASAACLLVRRDAFNLVGGFDVAFGRGYYEDVDLCLALRERGFVTVYEPRSVVTHVRGASGPVDHVAVSTNRGLIASRWRRQLANRPHATDHVGVGARDASASGRVLLLPDAESLEVARALAVARPDVRVTLLVPDDVPVAPAALRQHGIEVAIVKNVGLWLARRRFHYDVVVGDHAGDVLAATQPQARHLSPGSSVEALLMALDLPPDGSDGSAPVGRGLRTQPERHTIPTKASVRSAVTAT